MRVAVFWNLLIYKYMIYTIKISLNIELPIINNQYIHGYIAQPETRNLKL